MKKRCLSLCLTILSILILTLSSVQTRAHVNAASPPPPKTLAGYIPSTVTTGQARLIRHHRQTDQLALTIGLPLRNKQALTQLLHVASTPRNPQYRHYLTQAQANQAFNPTPQQEQQVTNWLQSHGLQVTHTYPNHLLVDATATFARIEQAFHVTINDYTMQLNSKQVTFYAPANEPTIDGSVGNVINTILGLDDYPSFHVAASLAPTRPASNGNAHGSPPYYPQDFANAYDVNPLWKNGDTGKGQHIGIVLWGPAPSDTTLVQFHTVTGANVATRLKTYGPRLQVIPVDSGPYVSSKSQAVEAGIDVESSSGMAPGATIDYYEAPTDQNGTPTTQGLEDALNMAGSDTNNNAQISDSWGDCEATNTSDPFTMQAEQIFQSNTATGHDYFFSSGDNGSACVPDSSNNPCSFTDPYPQYPASSAYVTSVGGTNLGIQNNSWQSEVAWNYTTSSCYLGSGNPPKGSGGGYSKLFTRPGWQVGYSKNKYRGYPDVAADADLLTGAYICADNGSNNSTCGTSEGTSLATPLWAGMIADVNQYVQSKNMLPLGFINPLLYTMSKGSPYSAYHDILKGEGTNGTYYTGSGWDAVTGLGSPNLYNLARDAVGLDASASSNDPLDGIAAVSSTDVWAVGNYHDSSGHQEALIEHWNGSSWNVLPSSGYMGNLTSVAAVSATDVWAVGGNTDASYDTYTLIEHWNGSSWNVLQSPNPGPYVDYLTSVSAVSANDVWAVGNYQEYGGHQNTLIEHWNGSYWSVVPSPYPTGDSANDLKSVSAVSANDVWAVGWYQDTSGNFNDLIEHWNGSTWNIVPSPNLGTGSYGNGFSGVAAVSSTDVWAVGSNELATLVEQWNGSTWSVVPSPNPGLYRGNGFSGVAAVSATNIWAVGGYTDTYGDPNTLIEHWNGSSWNVVPSPNPGPGSFGGNSLSNVTTVSATDVWAVGNYYDTNSAPIGFFEHWNGSGWIVVPSPHP